MSDEDRKIITKAQLIIEKMKGSITDEEYQAIWNMIKSYKGINCRTCDDEGVVVKPKFSEFSKSIGSTTYRCFCLKGERFPKLPWFVKNK